MAALKYWLWLSSAAVSSKAKARLLRRYGDAESAWNAPKGEFADIEGISPAEAGILENRDMSLVIRIIMRCKAQNISIITMQDAQYPKRLKNIDSPPPVLYVKGTLPPVDDSAVIAVLGTRKASIYGIKMASKLAGELAECGGIVLSGLTAGIDAEAARAAVKAGGVCIGVLGSSHSECRSELAAKVLEKGALISEHYPGTKTHKRFFRDRNRISSGLSVAAVVVEAPEKSGALLFAQETAEQGRALFAVPGNADSQNSIGTIRLLKDGAAPATEGWDILSQFQSRFPALAYRSIAAENTDVGESAPEAAEPDAELEQSLSQLSAQQLKIVTAIDTDGTAVDDIIDKTGLDLRLVMTELTMLRIMGIVRDLPGNRIILNMAKK